MIPIFIQTERLILRSLTVEDAPFILVLLNSPGWLKYIGDRHIHNIRDAVSYLSKGPLSSYEEYGLGLFAVDLAADKQTVGVCGLLRRSHWNEIDLGFAFLPEYTGKGYAYEAAVAVIRDGEERLGISNIIAITLPSNTSSIRLLEKLGMKQEGITNDPAGGEILFLYRLQIKPDREES